MILPGELFNAIDSRTTRSLLDLLRRWRRHGRTVIAVLHDLDQVRELFVKMLLIARDVVAWRRTEAVLTEPSLSRALDMAVAWDDTALPACGSA